jgi:hypothetical protein
MPTAAMRVAIRNEKRIPKAPRPIDNRIYATKNLPEVARTSKIRTFLALDIPSKAKRAIKLIGERASNTIATHKNSLSDA